MPADSPKILIVALLAGIMPALIWLWFWLREDRKKPEPAGLLTLVFIAGMIAVFFVVPIQKFIRANVDSYSAEIILWATAEEIIKYLAVIIVLSRTHLINEPIDWPIYLITVALGFAALENTLFLMKPFSLNETTVGLMTGQLRFLGSTLLHAVASGMVGIALGLSFYLSNAKKRFYLFSSLIVAVTLHSTFNFFIMKNSGSDFLKVFGFLWVVTIILMLLFEKLRRMSGIIN
jgi:RsiW-degrading membrane proteinase PrsW (M82 family)